MRESFLKKIKEKTGLSALEKLRETSAAFESVTPYKLNGAVVKKGGDIEILKYGDIQEISPMIKQRDEAEVVPNESDKEILVEELGGKNIEVALLNPTKLSGNFTHQYKEMENFLIKNLIEQKLCNYVAVVTKVEGVAGARLRAEIADQQKGIKDPLFEEGDFILTHEMASTSYTKEKVEELLEKPFFDVKEKTISDTEDAKKGRKASRLWRELDELKLKKDYNTFLEKAQEYKNLKGYDTPFTKMTEEEFNIKADMRIKIEQETLKLKEDLDGLLVKRDYNAYIKKAQELASLMSVINPFYSWDDDDSRLTEKEFNMKADVRIKRGY